MRLWNARDLGLFVRDRRRSRNLTQAQAAAAAGVSQRWLASLEAGKETVEVGLVFKLLHSLELMMNVEPDPGPPPGTIDLDALIRAHGPQP